MTLKHFDAFSGYGGFTVATLGMDIETVGFSEIDHEIKNGRREKNHAPNVLKYHWPNITNYGNITKINWNNVPDFDFLTGGSPCQDFSIAGKRKGLGGARSSLAWEFIRCLRSKQPSYFLWENVKGALSSRGGWDFANLLCAFSESGYALWWQVLNAKDFGVAQSRERIFVFGSREKSPQEVFFESQDRGKNLKELTNKASQGYRVYSPDGVATTLASQAGGVGARTGLYFVDLQLQDAEITETARTIQARYYKGWSNRYGENSGVMIVQRKRGFNKGGLKEMAPAVTTSKYQDNNHLIANGRIRRLTPRECERLMGLKDDHTRYGIDEQGKKYELSDSARYKLCGNGIVPAVAREIIQKQINL